MTAFGTPVGTPGTAVGVGLAVVVGVLVVVEPRVAAVAAVIAIVGCVAAAVTARGADIAGLAWGAVAFTAPFNGVRLSSSVALSDLFLLVAVVAMLPTIALRRRSLRRSGDGVLVGLAMIAAGGLVGTLFAVRPEASLVEVAKFVFAAAGSIVAMRLWEPDPARVRRFCALWLGGAVVSSLWALTFSPSIVGRPLGLSTHPNHLGIVCLLGAAIALGFALGGRSVARRLCMLALLPLVVALVACGSRAALLGFFVVVPTVALMTLRVQLAVRAGAVAAIFGLAVLAGVVHLPADTGLARLFGDGSTSGSDASRIDLLSSSIDRYERHPLTGEGFEFAQEAHNVYLQVLGASGPLGFLGLVVVVGSVLKAARRGIRAGPARVGGEHALLAGLAAGYVGYLVAALFQNILWDRYLWLYIAALLALASSLFSASSGAGRVGISDQLLVEDQVVGTTRVAQGPLELPPPDGRSGPGGDG